MEFNQSEKLPQQESPKDEMPTTIEVGSKLLSRLIEIAKEYGINKIWHTIQSLEGLMLINNKLKQPDRKYYLQGEGGEEEISFQEAVEVLKRKKEEGTQSDTSIMVNSATYIDRLEE
ncbi:hypothetical protein HY932_02650 [Candidatus Falkowbacteria bacterium]|nr:hypothetical protein [Candidatus Falkowbacteria bacterium]